jgi:hypothetical protein
MESFYLFCILKIVGFWASNEIILLRGKICSFKLENKFWSCIKAISGNILLKIRVKKSQSPLQIPEIYIDFSYFFLVDLPSPLQYLHR